MTPDEPTSLRTMSGYAGRQRNLAVVEALVDAIGDRAIVEQRCEDLMQRLDHVVEAADIEEGLLLPGKRSVRQVLRRGRRSDGDGDVLAAGHLVPGRA